MIEFLVFKTSLQEVHQFREWLMTAPVSEITARIDLEVSSGLSVSKKEGREHHAVDIRK
jgi:hypothetical protein